MFHVKYQDHVIFVGSVTWKIYIDFHSLFLLSLHMKVGIGWPSGFGQEIFENGERRLRMPIL